MKTLQQGMCLYHNGRVTPVELIEFIEHWHGEDIWTVLDLKEGGTQHIETFSKNDAIRFFQEAA